ncbi:hypothetical protein [uncultured Campylobacter sp.]|uniref:hypothetical protein n=1 Tax=uncultured Campylobacter sp. TaxID=218934 RepID=UPI0025DBC6FD|nr:hypothetical protein [uncultured Campylobacter sp.]
MKETRFVFYALWQAPCARVAIGKDIASPLSASGAGTARYVSRRIEISRRRLK